MTLIGHDVNLTEVPPTVLLTGPEGVGKRRAAHLLARNQAVGLDFQNLGHLRSSDVLDQILENEKPAPSRSGPDAGPR